VSALPLQLAAAHVPWRAVASTGSPHVEGAPNGHAMMSGRNASSDKGDILAQDLYRP
jgi:hypothetical protein